MSDQHRADHVGWHPASRLQLPNIDRLAEGCVFDRMLSVNPVCTPARCALLTGRYTHQIGMLAMSGDLSRDFRTYPQALQKAGYHTAGIGKFHWLQTWKWGAPRGLGVPLSSMHDELKGFGFDEVWEASGKQLALQNRCDWCEQLDRRGILEQYRDFVVASGPNFAGMQANGVGYTGTPWPFAEEDYVDIATCTRVLETIRSRPKDRPLFCFASFCGPHPPFDPPPRFLELVQDLAADEFASGAEEAVEMEASAAASMEKLQRAYRAMLLCLDEQVGRIYRTLEEEGIAEDTVILFISDHGEMLGDHGLFGKMRPRWQSVQVPAAIRDPRNLESRRCHTPTELTDFAATILDLAGLDPMAALGKDWPAFNSIVPSRSLMPVVRGEETRVRSFAFSECSPPPTVMPRWNLLEDDRFRYIRFAAEPPFERLYDLNSDPECLRDLASDPACSPTLTLMRDRLLDLLTKTPAAQTRWAPLMGPDGSEDHPLP
jgi:arylsulfatase